MTKESKIDRDREIIRLYTEEKKNVPTIGERFGIGIQTVYDVLMKYSIPRGCPSEYARTTQINKNYFDNIDHPNKAYILGLLYADGCLVDKENEIKIFLQEQDKKILCDIKDCLEYSGQLRYRKSEIPKYKNQWCLDFRSKHMSNKLKQLGLVPRKSLILKFPTEAQVPKHLLNHFIRGYFDGDGCIHIRSTRSKTCSISFIGTFEMMTGIFETLNTVVKMKPRKFYQPKNARVENKNTYTFSIERKKDVLSILDYLYKDATLFLNRKRDKCQEFLTMCSK